MSKTEIRMYEAIDDHRNTFELEKTLAEVNASGGKVISVTSTNTSDNYVVTRFFVEFEITEPISTTATKAGEPLDESLLGPRGNKN